MENQTVNKMTKEKKEGSFIGDVFDVFEAVIISVFIVVLFFAYVARPVTVDGSSMRATLTDGDKLFMSDFLYTPKHGDIVVVDNKCSWTYDEKGNLKQGNGLGDPDKRLIKRVIAVGGDELDIHFENGEVYVNGELLDEPYINNPTTSNLGGFTYPLHVPEGYLFVMGDNRQNSTDSRSAAVGFVSENQVLGKALFRFAPFSEFGSIYD